MTSLLVCILALTMMGISLADMKCKDKKQDYLDEIECIQQVLANYDNDYFLTEQDETDIETCINEKYGYYDVDGSFNVDNAIKSLDDYDFDPKTKQQLTNAAKDCAKSYPGVAKVEDALDCYSDKYEDICEN